MEKLKYNKQYQSHENRVYPSACLRLKDGHENFVYDLHVKNRQHTKYHETVNQAKAMKPKILMLYELNIA